MRVRIAVFTLLVSLAAHAQQPRSLFPNDVRYQMDVAAVQTLRDTGVPSASIAVVKDGRMAYLQTYGESRLEPRTPVRPDMRYSIGSISKQFTAVALLLLQEQGKLSLDDPVGKFLPNLTRARDVTIRQVLTHTSGYSDFWPQDYVMPMMLKPTTAAQIMDTWARKPLDFEPGTRWQYSNTGYVIAGAIIEKVTGKPYFQFLRDHIFTPLNMTSVADFDQHGVAPTDPTGYLRYGLGPARVAPAEGAGWMFAAGELAMTAEDLARWDIALIERKIMSPASYQQFETETVLANGLGTQYGLGVFVRSESGHRALTHGGEVSGFTATNTVFPDDRVAVVVLTNQDAANASGTIAKKLATLALQDADTARKLEQAQQIFAGLQKGTINRALFTDNANSYFSEQALKDFASSLGPLGAPKEFTQTNQSLRGGMMLRVYQVKFADKALRAWTFEMPDGKLEQYQVAAAD
ncbi:MAG: beta-lactamase family protein [Acidobacteriia bacterium]|nr:beta-lactamase family protein [Terriglobia bacterium]